MSNLYDKIFRPKTIVLNNGHSVKKPASRTPLIVLFLLGACFISSRITGVDFGILTQRGGQFFIILRQILMPDFSFATSVWTPLLNTIQMSIIGTVIGCVCALPFAVASSSNIVKNRFIIMILRLILSIVRTLPTLVIALIATMIFGLGTFAGTIAIAIFTFGMMAKMTYEHIETVDMGAYEALEAIGSPKPKAFLAAIFPEITPIYLSNCLYCVETNVRNASVLGYVGAGGIGLIMNERLAWREYRQVGMILLSLFVAVLVIDGISKFCRYKLMGGVAK